MSTYAELVARREKNPLWIHTENYKAQLWSLITDKNRIRHILIVTGQGGIGKTRIFRDMIGRFHLKPDRMSSDTNPLQFIRQLHQYRDGDMIWWDDAGNLDSAAAICETAKAAFGPDPRTVVHNIIGNKNEPPPPPSFNVSAPLVWLSNKNLDKNSSRTFDALLTRATLIDMDKGVNDSDLFEYTLCLVTLDKMLMTFDEKVQIDTVKYYIDNRNKLTDLTPRHIEYIASKFDQQRKYRERSKEPLYDAEKVLRCHLNSKDREDKINCFEHPLTIENGEWKELIPQIPVRQTRKRA
jgi:hypothetical protein